MDKKTLEYRLKRGIIKDLHARGLISKKQMEQALKQSEAGAKKC